MRSGSKPRGILYKSITIRRFVSYVGYVVSRKKKKKNLEIPHISKNFDLLNFQIFQYLQYLNYFSIPQIDDTIFFFHTIPIYFYFIHFYRMIIIKDSLDVYLDEFP